MGVEIVGWLRKQEQHLPTGHGKLESLFVNMCRGRHAETREAET